jgi:beta-galactosidase/beta-glucuronidase
MKLLLSLVLVLAIPSALDAADAVPLAGKWRFDLDQADSGIADQWFDRSLAHEILLPGSLPERGVGDDVTVDTSWMGGIVDRSFFDSPAYAKDREPGHVRIPFWLQPDKYYAGVVWFQRDVTVLSDWRDRRVTLFLERPHWETRVWIDGRLVGTNNSLATPHDYDLGPIEPGRHTLTIRVDNRGVIDIGENSHCISDHTQGNWNGIVGGIELRSTPRLWIDDLQVYPHPAAKSITVKGVLGNSSGRAGAGAIRLTVLAKGKTVADKTLEIQTADGTHFEAEIPLGAHAETWDEFHPALYTLRASFADASRSVTFGLREIATDGTQFVINGRKTFIRGTLECCIFPKTGHPPTEVGEWKRILRIARAHGLNLLRFHSYCPPEAAFIAGDELGFYFQVETCWANQSITIGDGKPVD